MSFGEVFERYNVSYGLANNVVFDVAEDKYGFMWVTTRNGISRFDGSDFVTYRPVPPGVQGQVAQSYLKIYPDRNGNLWFCSWGNGLLRLDVDTEQFTFFRHDPNDPESIAGNEVWFAFEDRDGMIWVSSLGGLSQLNPATGKAHVYRHDPTNLNSLSHNLPMQVVQDAAGELWIGTYGGGLDRFDLKTQTFAHYRHRKGIANSLIDDRIEGLFLDRDGTLWIATNGGLDHFDPASGRFTGYKHDPNDPGSLSNDVVMQATRDSRGRIWTSNLGGGIHRLDEATGKFTHYGYDPANPRGLSMNLCLYFRESRDGAMWFASANGLNRYDEQGGRFQPLLRQPGPPGARGDIAVSGAQQDRQGRLWITSDDVGLVRYDPVKRQYRQYAPEAGNPHSLSNVSATSITMDPAGAIWIGTRAGFNRYDAATDQFERFTVARYGSGGTALDNIPDIAADRQGVIWLAIYGLGLQRFDPKRQAFTLFNHKANDPASLGNDQASVVRVGSDGSVWVGCDAGLSRLDPASGKFTNFAAGQDGLSSIIVNAIAEAPGGAMLFGTDVGVDVYDTRAKRFTAYTVREGMPSNYVMALQSDQAGNIWAGTDKGLVRIDTRSGKIRVYDVNDGLPSNQFWNHAAYRAPDGTMYFGGMNGLAFFRPELLRDNPVPPPVYITGFSLFNRKVVPGPGSPLKSGIIVTKAVTLDYRQSSLSFRFAALNYRWSKKNQYAYKLEGFDDGWTAVDSSKREAVYTNLSPGHYVFHVKASNNDGVWNEAGTSLTITITPPWWQTGWFRSLCVAAFLGLLAAADKLRLRRVAQQFNMRMEERVAERTRIARDLHDTMLQTFQGVLLKFYSLSVMLADRPEAQQKLEDLLEEERQAINEGREAVQGLRSSTVIANDLARAFTTLGEELAAKQGSPNPVAFQVEVEGETRDLHPIVRDEVYRIACHALRNAFQHSGAARIEVSIHYDDRQFRVCIRDNGKGIDPKVLEAGGREAHYGMPGMQERAKLAGGRLVVRSRVNSGTEAEIIIPAAGAYAKSRSPRRSAFLRRGA